MEFLGGVQDRFEEDRADLMPVKDFTPGPALTAHPLPAVEAVLVASASHPLAQEAGSVTLESCTVSSTCRCSASSRC